MMTTEEDKANNIKDDDSTNTNNNAAENDNDNDNEEHQHQNEQNEQNEQNKQQLMLFESLLIKRIVKFLNYKPYDFAITLLPSPSSQSQSSPLVSCDETINDDEEDDNNNNSLLLSLTPEYRNLLETSIMLIREEEEEEDVVNENNNNNEDTPKATATTAGTTKATTKYHLGLEAQYLPFIAKTLRKVYHTTKMKMKKAKANAKKLQEDSNNSNSNKNKEEEVELEETKTTTLNLLLFDITSCLLLIQPDHSTVWSDRRRCLLFQIQRMEKEENELLLMMWYNELDYLDLLMTQHSKAPSSWAHRKYVLRQLISLHNKHHQQLDVNNYMKSFGNMTSIQDLVMKEVNGICSSVAENYPKNYYAWTHRIYVVSELLLPATMFIKTNSIIGHISTKISKFLETELNEKMYNEWLPKHPTDHSAIHYTCQILDYLFDILNQKEYYLRLCFMEMYDDDDDDGYEEEWHNQQLKNLHTEVAKKKYELSILALKHVQILLSKYYQSSNSSPNSNSNCNCNESLWILRRMTCQIIWNHSSSLSSSSYIVNKHHRNENENDLLRMMMMRQLVRNDIKAVIDSLNIIARVSSSSSDEEEDASLSLSLSQLVDAADNANGDDEKMDATSNKNNIHAWTFLAWCIVNLPNIDDDDDDNNGNSNSNDNEKTKRPSSSSSSLSLSLSSFSSTTTSTTTTLFTHDIRETVMRRLQGAEATATATATASNNDGSTTSTTAHHNTRLWTSSSSPNIVLV